MSTMPFMDWYRHYRQVYLEAAAPKREPHIYTPAQDPGRGSYVHDAAQSFAEARTADWESVAFPLMTHPQPDTAERTRLAVRSIPFALPEKRPNG